MKRSLFWLLEHYAETSEHVSVTHRAALEQAIEADRLGFTSLWLAEHHFSSIGTVPNPAVLLAAVAQSTKQIRLGPAITVLPLRNPIQVAEDYALVDSISNGRLNMGVGSGSAPEEFGPFGVEWECRKELYETNLTAIRDRWEAASRGEHGSSSINVAPVQSPTPPIYVATMSEDAAYHIGCAGESMLTLSSLLGTPAEEPVARIRAHTRGLSETGESADSVLMMFAHVADTDAELRATAIPALARQILLMTGKELVDPEGFYEKLRAEDLALFGTPSEASEQLDRLADRGVDHIAFITGFGGMSRASALRSLRLLAPDSGLGGINSLSA